MALEKALSERICEPKTLEYLFEQTPQLSILLQVSLQANENKNSRA